jgi:small subunit ribosomal protein S2
MENNKNTEQNMNTEYQPVEINLKSLLQVGGHFGTKTSLWNPKCAPFIYGVRNGVYIINLEDTVKFWRQAREVIVNTVAAGGTVLFVGTKKQARDAVIKHAERCGAFYVNYKWAAGTLTNFNVLRKSIDKMESLEAIVKEAAETGKSTYTKKELLMFQREINKMLRSFGGIRGMKTLPTVVFITDAKTESLAVSEANKTGVPIISLSDTDCEPGLLTYPIPANDDAVRALDLFCAAVADAVLAGKEQQRVNQLVADKLAQEAKPVEEPITQELREKMVQTPQPAQPPRRTKDNKSSRDRDRARNRTFQVETKKR